MNAFTLVPWWGTNVLVSVLLYRGLRTRWAREYPVFWAYLAFVLAKSVVLFRLMVVSRQAYAIGYWAAELIATVLGVFIVRELYGAMLTPYPGACRMARALIAAFLGMVFVHAAAALGEHPLTVLMPTTVELQRNLRFLQALLMTIMLFLVGYYRIPLGRNVKYLFVGYGMVVGTSMMNLTLRSALGAPFQRLWTVLGPLEYFAIVTSWCIGLWSRSRTPLPSSALAADYDTVNRLTSLGIARLRSRVVGVFRWD